MSDKQYQGIVDEGAALLRAWTAYQADIERRRRELMDAERNCEAARNALAKWMLPKDSAMNDSVSLWVWHNLEDRELLVTATRLATGYGVTVRRTSRTGGAT